MFTKTQSHLPLKIFYKCIYKNSTVNIIPSLYNISAILLQTVFNELQSIVIFTLYCEISWYKLYVISL